MNDRRSTRRITSRAELESALPLSNSEREFFRREGEADRLPLAVTPHLLSLMGDDETDPIRRQFVPTADELSTKEYELDDPLGEEGYTVRPRLVHRYPDRVLLLTTDSCGAHCRHCFRRRFAGSGRGAMTSSEVEAAADYLRDHPEVREVLLSGGDPLTLSPPRLGHLLATLRSTRGDLVVRLATRVPVVSPERLDDEVLSLIADHKPLWVVVQVNHPAELGKPTAAVLSALISAGVPVVTQTVLLRGVNDSVDVLEELFTRLVALMIKPYYLFQGDLAQGTSHFRVPLDRGLELVRELRRRVSGLAMPVYAVDLPGGGGKVPLTEGYLLGRDGSFYVLKSPAGEEYRYPVEEPS